MKLSYPSWLEIMNDLMNERTLFFFRRFFFLLFGASCSFSMICMFIVVYFTSLLRMYVVVFLRMFPCVSARVVVFLLLVFSCCFWTLPCLLCRCVCLCQHKGHLGLISQSRRRCFGPRMYGCPRRCRWVVGLLSCVCFFCVSRGEKVLLSVPGPSFVSSIKA